MRRKLGRSARIAFVLVALGAWAEAGDYVITRKGEKHTGRITKDDANGVDLNLPAGGKMSFRNQEIKEVYIHPVNPTAINAVQSFKAGSYETALNLLDECVAPELEKDIPGMARPYLHFYRSECQLRLARFDDAVASLENFRKNFKTSRLLPDVSMKLVEAYLGAKKYKEADTVAAELEKIGGVHELYGILLRGDSAFAQGRYDEAYERYGKVTASGEDFAKMLKPKAFLGQARCLIARDKTGKAQEMAMKALEDREATDEVMAGAHLIVGHSLLIEGRKLSGEQAREKLLDAALEFLRVPVLYSESQPSLAAEALFHAGECFRQLADFKDLQATYLKRSREMYNTVIQHYKGTKWAKMAQEKIGGAGAT
ncbi:MAG: hypothetical protein N3A38_09510 [Planctomycetota bacterium]|nr:hypothetical protein [Planctomycetota bacterium]